MNFEDMIKAEQDAKNTLRLADNLVSKLGSLMINRLRKVDGYTLAKLKKELDNFDSRTKSWK